MKRLISYIIIGGFLFAGACAKKEENKSATVEEAIGEVSIRKVSEQELSDFDLLEYPSDSSTMPEKDSETQPMVTDITKIVNAGLKIWKLVEDNAPVMEVEGKIAHALPRGIRCWNELEQWQTPRSAVYEISYKNLMGVEVTKFQFRLIFTHGGEIEGQGKYIANLSVRPSNVNVLWGYHFYAGVEIPQVVNMGTKTDPVAGAEITVNWRVETMLKKSSNSVSFFVNGNGELKAL